MNPTVHQICEYSEQVDDSVQIGGDIERISDIELSGVNSFENAVLGDISWLSPKRVTENPDFAKSFDGTMLICPHGICKDFHFGSVIICCNDAKLMFSMIVNKFFEILTAIKWPECSDGHIYPGTLVGKACEISRGVVIGSNVFIGDNVRIGPNTVIANCKIGCGTKIGSNCSIGLPGFGYAKDESGRYVRFPHVGGVILGKKVEIGSNTCIDRGALGDTVIGKNAKIDNLVHIAHNVILGENAMVIANSMLGGSVFMGNNVWVAPSVSVMNQISIGDSAMLGLGSVVLKNVETSAVMVGNPARKLR